MSTKRLFKADGSVERVGNISPYLVEGSSLCVKQRTKPLHSGTVMIRGNTAYDFGNLLLSKEDRLFLLKNEPISAKWIKRAMGSDEFINAKERWCLWLVGATKEDLSLMPLISERVEKVKKMRLKNKDKAVNKMAARPHEFRDTNNPSNYILVPRVSSHERPYIPMGFFDANVICTDRNQMIPNGTLFDFGMLNSVAHNDWMRLVTGRLGMGFNYSNTIVYNTFPFPDCNEAQKSEVEKLAQAILDTRDKYDMTLAKMYNPETMPEPLKTAHKRLDEYVDRLYRPEGFKSTSERLEHLLRLYENAIKEDI